ncbi:polysaccharide biosynthesis protein [Tissierella creatinophila]|uniref:UDP-N-acetyl-alpha-D-glucosamine C6 dehydratase n=1 Tax=Tissierella creatinophila DSM 6911 TaxID=1123403 RepID=A0A1U7M3M3_TISCR|nr:nucleoside-diphosphate sugar epimerase/dehydratase [Tissierella creatinophila]OLS01798.1 UDP-N-acetyl-alpha-D-glucosamine C6 dehydratase [Tissierella creatinophila DSM 6911]
MDNKPTKIKLILEDILLINLSYILALYIRFDTINHPRFAIYFELYIKTAIFITIAKLVVFNLFNMYNTLWKYASIKELKNIVLAVFLSNAIVISFLFISGNNLPRSVYVIVPLLEMFLIGGIRFSYRTFSKNNILRRFKAKNRKRILIIGAGDAGAMVIREFRNHEKLNSEPIAIIDDDKSKKGSVINGIKVVGGRDDIINVSKEYRIDEIIIAMPSASKAEIKEILDICKETRCKLKMLPGIYELIDEKVSIKEIRDVEISDVLGREEIRVDLEKISSYITDKTVMITGAGGSIGSELCRQMVGFKPKRLVLLDIYENSVYDVQMELNRNYPDLNLKVYIGSIRDKARLEEIFLIEKPQVVFHAAAHKHVPLMEDSPKEAIKNNVFGTLNLAELSDKYSLERFVMISTDKAVNPTNIMGASKRLCEMIIQSINVHSKTEFVAVRFGNVLGSNGSVIPLFKKQIEEGGPVTVTHPDIIRYFMTIPEAVQLVIQAGSMAKGGEIFILDMGEPVKIIDLARDVIRLSGFEPDIDMPIKITGLRPGEKLLEELLLEEEGLTNTSHNKIFVAKPTFTDYRLLLKSLDGLKALIKDGDVEKVREQVKMIVPTYKDNRVVNKEIEEKRKNS